MKQLDQLTIREFGLLHRGGQLNNIDNQSILESDWDWLKNEAPRFAADEAQFIKPILSNRTFAIQVCNYVGVICLPSGHTLEILPKISEQDSIEECRASVFNMLSRVHQLPFKESNDADLEVFERPLLEILIGRFLAVALRVINKGLRFDYRMIEEDSAYLRGKLQVHLYAQSPPSKKLRFPVEFTEYLSNRPENRLLHWAVQRVFHSSIDNNHRSQARKILMQLSEIPASNDPLADMRQWSDQRLMRHYRPLKPWIDLILKNQTPLSQKGPRAGLSLLFPMEKLFERYVSEIVKMQLAPGYSLIHDREGGKLAKFNDKHLVSLRPDIQVQCGNQTFSIMDAKWKSLTRSDDVTAMAKNVSTSDLYQMFAYAKKILPDGGDLFLVFPKTTNFSEPMHEVHLSHKHKLSLVPLDLLAEELKLSVDFFH